MTSRCLLLSLLLAIVPVLGCLSAPSDDGEDLGAGGLAAVCKAKPLEVIVKGRENRFGLDGQQVALNPGIPMERICKQVASGCTQICNTAKAQAEATGIKGFQDTDPVRLGQMGKLADTFNAALGLSTRFADLGQPAPGDDDDLVCNGTPLQVIVQGREHRFGFDNRQVALNPAIPMQNLCQRVSAGCVATCNAARNEAIATGIKGFTGDLDLAKLGAMGELADAFNAALGLITNFADLGDGAGAGGGGGGGAPAVCAVRQLQVLVKGREHRFGFDNRQVALNPSIPMINLCQQLSGACATTCNTARAAAEATGIKGFTGNLDAFKLSQMGKLADTFNAALGSPSRFETSAIFLP